MKFESSEIFVRSLKERIEKIKMTREVERNVFEECFVLVLDVLKSIDSIEIRDTKNFKTSDLSAYVDFKSENLRDFVAGFKRSLRKISKHVSFVDLGKTHVISVDLSSVNIISGKADKHIIFEIYKKDRSDSYRIKMSTSEKLKHCGRIHRKNMKWIIWIWTDSLIKLELERVDPFDYPVIFKGKIEEGEIEIEANLESDGFNYEIISLKQV